MSSAELFLPQFLNQEPKNRADQLTSGDLGRLANAIIVLI